MRDQDITSSIDTIETTALHTNTAILNTTTEEIAEESIDNKKTLSIHPAKLDPERLEDLMLLMECDGKDFLEDLFSTYVTDSSQRIANLKEAIRKQSQEDISAYAHALKGASRNMGATEFASLCQQLEKEHASMTKEETDSLLQSITLALSSVEQALQIELDQIEEPATIAG